MEHLPTVTIEQNGQRMVINDSDYHHPDGSVKSEWQSAKLVSHNQLAESALRHNEAEAVKRAEAARITQAERDAALAPLKEAAAEISDDLAGFIEALPTKGAVLAYAQAKGVELDGTATRPVLNDEAVAAIEALAEPKGQEGAGA